MALHQHVHAERSDEVVAFRPQFAEPGETAGVPRFQISEQGMDPHTAYQVVHDELMLDGNARLNLATFVTTWMEPQARALLDECADKNMVDKDEYPQTAELEMRCVNMLAQLWNASDAEHATGTSTTGSSEAGMLGGLALKWRWRERRRALDLPTDRPNLVMGANVQVCWEKFCRYWDVEPRMVPVTAECSHLSVQGALAHCDENTIGVVAVLGSTFDGAYEPVAGIAGALDELEQHSGIDIPLHVDGASGGFIAPFLDPDLVWDFRLPRVQSINASGHKFGLVYPGVGWVIWRDQQALPKDLVFDVDYLGGSMPTFGLNFSRPGAQIVAQYYNFIRLGITGFTRGQQACRDTAMWLASELASLGPFSLVSDGSDLPVLAVRLRDEVTYYTVYDVSDMLRGHGWLVPAYTMPPDQEEVAVLRVVVRNGFSRNLAELLVADVKRVVMRLEHRGGEVDEERQAGFHH
ncbi:MAG: glutamate decarboxylase [Acidimicrobiales bacterium]